MKKIWEEDDDTGGTGERKRLEPIAKRIVDKIARKGMRQGLGCVKIAEDLNKSGVTRANGGRWRSADAANVMARLRRCPETLREKRKRERVESSGSLLVS